MNCSDCKHPIKRHDPVCKVVVNGTPCGCVPRRFTYEEPEKVLFKGIVRQCPRCGVRWMLEMGDKWNCMNCDFIVVSALPKKRSWLHLFVSVMTVVDILLILIFLEVVWRLP